MDYIALHKNFKEHSLFGRYIHLDHINPLLQQYPTQIVGKSVCDNPIYFFEVGSGKTKILMWSQMHGNETTTTKALFDFLQYLHSNHQSAQNLLSRFTFGFLPMVNPDGAKNYTRVNANNVDLNRDSVQLSQPESKVLNGIILKFKPNYCYNLHDQRTIFGVGIEPKPATISFLAPSYNEAREYNDTRLKAIAIINQMNTELQKHIPNQVGRFDDGFNINCIGDYCTALQIPTILFEAGHYQNDYHREFSRKIVFIALVQGLLNFPENDIVANDLEQYLNIPQNEAVFFDFIYKNVKINYDDNEIITNFAVQYKEVLIDKNVELQAYISDIGELKGKYGHVVYNAHKMSYSDNLKNIPIIDEKADFSIGKSTFFVNGLKI